MKPDVQQMRYQAGSVMIKEAGKLELSEEEIKWLLATLPATFRFGREDVGFLLKKKLYETYLGNKAE